MSQHPKLVSTSPSIVVNATGHWTATYSQTSSFSEWLKKGLEQGRLTKARKALRRILAGRQLTPKKRDEARVDACHDLATLERWLDQAITARSVSEALR